MIVRSSKYSARHTNATAVRVELSRRADHDLEAVYDYGLSEFGSAVADRYAADLNASINQLRDYPRLGEKADYIGDGLRKLTCGVHLIYYQLGAETIIVAHVLHARMDALRHFPR